MKQIIPINAIGGNISPAITAHYHKAGGSDFTPHERNHIPHLAILEIMEDPKPVQVAQIYDQEQNPMNGRVYSEDGIAPTLRTPTGGLSEPCILGYTRDNKGNVTSRHEKEIAGTLHTSTGNGGNTDQFVKTRYRIRKLTERECFRLMDMDDSDIDKIEAHRIKVTQKNGTVKEKPIPKSAKYKLAGNSIVVSCLYHIFHQMFIAEPPEPKPIQKSLFDF